MFNSYSTHTSNCAVLADSIRAKYERCIAAGSFNQKRQKDLENAIKLQVEPVSRKLEYYFHSDNLSQIIAMATKSDLVGLIEDEARYLRKKNYLAHGVFKLTPIQLRNIRKRIDAFNFIFHSRKSELFIQYEETVLYRQFDVYCPVCGKKMEFRTGKKFNAYYCPSGHDVMVSCHPHTAMPTGMAATLPTRIKRANLHMLTDQVFKGSTKELYLFLERMLGREFNDYDGHIGSMDSNECDRMINLFQFLNKRAGYLELLKKTTPNDYILEEYFLANATHREMQVYYLWVTSDFSKDKVMRIFNVSEHNFIDFMRPMIEKGMPCGNLKISLTEQETLIKELASSNFETLF